MALTITATSTDDVYTTTAYVKSLIGTTATSDDATISALIRAASRWVDNYLGYPLVATKYRETVPTFDRRKMMLSRAPLRNVSGLYFGTDTGTDDQLLASEYRVESSDAGMLSRDEGWEWTVPVQQDLTQRPLSGQEFKPWLVDYVAGYTYAGVDTGSNLWSTEHGATSTARTLPEDIEHATALKAIAMYQGIDSAQGDVTKEQLGDLEIWYSASTGGIERARTAAQELLLDPYRRMV